MAGQTISIARRDSEYPLEFRAGRGRSGAGTLAGLAAVYFDPARPETQWRLEEDLVERIMPGAFDEVLADESAEVLALSDHDPTRLLGRRSAGTLRLFGEKIGLRFEVDLPDTQEGRDVRELAVRGDLAGASIGMRVLSEGWRIEDGVTIREVRKVSLRDLGPTAIPAYAATSLEARSAEYRPALEVFRRELARSSSRQRLARAIQADVDTLEARPVER